MDSKMYHTRAPEKRRGREDVNQWAFRIAGELTGALPRVLRDTPEGAKGQAGGRVGGRARATRLTAEERSAIAKRAAEVRWKDHTKV